MNKLFEVIKDDVIGAPEGSLVYHDQLGIG